MNITFEELRRIKHSLPHGSISRIANELKKDEQDVRNYFGPLKFKGTTDDWHIEPGPDGGIINLNDTTILDMANRILREAERS
jgi:hypothetical protein